MIIPSKEGILLLIALDQRQRKYCWKIFTGYLACLGLPPTTWRSTPRRFTFPPPRGTRGILRDVAFPALPSRQNNTSSRFGPGRQSVSRLSLLDVAGADSHRSLGLRIHGRPGTPIDDFYSVSFVVTVRVWLPTPPCRYFGYRFGLRARHVLGLQHPTPAYTT